MRPEKLTCFVFFAMFIIIVMYYGTVFAGARGVTISPTRLIFDGRNRAAVVHIVNPDKKEVTYRISLTSLRMNEKGKTREVQSLTADEILSKKLIRFAPRQATLAPGAKQAIRLMVRKPHKLANGEYRTHLKITPIPNEKRNKQNPTDNEGTHIKIDLLVGVTIPIIVRHGKLTMNVIPYKAVLKKHSKTKKNYLEIGLEREGNRSAQIDLLAYYLPEHGEKVVRIGQLNGITIYTPNKYILTEVPITYPKRANAAGSIRVVIKERETDRNVTIGAKEFPLESIVGLSE